jgi:hypothetical protein
MDLQTLASIGEFLGGFAILVSLVYLLVSVRQNTSQLGDNLRSQQREEKRSAYAQHDRFRSALLDRELAELWINGTAGERLKDRADQLRFSNLLFMTTYASQNTWDVGQQGLDRDVGTFERVAAGVAGLYETPGGRRWWEKNRTGFDPEFVEAVERHRRTDE